MKNTNTSSGDNNSKKNIFIKSTFLNLKSKLIEVLFEDGIIRQDVFGYKVKNYSKSTINKDVIMAFSINTNLTALQSYNALAKINTKTYQSQIRLATGKRINSVADDTSGFNIGKALESKAMVNKAELNNADAALNYLSTAEASLQQVNDMLTQIQAKYVDSKDAAKDTSSIAKDIRSIAREIDSIMKNTKFNDQNLLAQSDGSTLASNAIFDVSGDVTMDFADSSYLDVDTLMNKINGTSTVDPGVASYDGTTYDIMGTDIISSNIDSTITVTFADNSTRTCNFTYAAGTYSLNNGQLEGDLRFALLDQAGIFFDTDISGNLTNIRDYYNVKNIVSLVTTSGYDVTTAFGITRESSVSGSGGLLSTDNSEVLSSAGDLSGVVNNVKSALGRIGNLTQQVQIRSDFLTSSIANSESSVSRLFDADMAQEQLTATKNSIGGQAAMQMLAQANTNPQQLLQLFR